MGRNKKRGKGGNTMKQFPLAYKLIIILLLVAGFFGLVNSWIIEYGHRQSIEESSITRVESLIEFTEVLISGKLFTIIKSY